LRFFTFLTALLFTTFCFSQGQPGYYITNSGQRVDGFFKTTDYYNSNSLEFSTGNSGEFAALQPEDIKEYGVGSTFKFQRHTFKMDASDNSDLKSLSSIKEPVYKTYTMFLNVIVEGKVSLYSLDINKSTRFFYSKENNPEIVQLIFKKYKQTQGTVLENSYFKQQLFNEINCRKKSTTDLYNISYSKSGLTRIFEEENKCLGSSPLVYSNTGSREIKFLYTLFGGLYSSEFSLEGSRFASGSNSEIAYGLGGELALALPSGKWEAFVRVEYETLSVEAETTTKQAFRTIHNAATFDANILNFYIGPRYNIILNDKNKLFIDGAVGLSIPSGDVVITTTIITNAGEAYVSETGNYSLSNTIAGNFSAGYIFNDKIGLALKYETSRNLFDNTNVGYAAKVGRIGLNLRYTIN
jgi:hypothetical protein